MTARDATLDTDREDEPKRGEEGLDIEIPTGSRP
jgi:hypothetical protein